MSNSREKELSKDKNGVNLSINIKRGNGSIDNEAQNSHFQTKSLKKI